MKPFHFRLEALLDFRRIKEEQAQIQLVQATGQLQKEQNILKQLQGKMARALNESRTKRQGCLTIETIKLFQLYTDKIIREIENQSQRVEQAASFRQQCFLEFEEAAKARKLVEKLKEKNRMQHEQEALREEQKLLDEIGLQLYVRES